MKLERVKLRRLAPEQAASMLRSAVDDDTLAAAAAIVHDVAREGDVALRRYAERHDALDRAAQLVIDRAALERAAQQIDGELAALLERTAARIRRFAEAQRAALGDVDIAIDGGRAGHRMIAVDRAGCYAPGGSYPLVSSLLMTAVTARAAGVRQVVVASPRPSQVMLAAAALAGADAVLAAGGAHAIAALALGTASVPRVDVIAGPGSKWVTAAKQLLVGRVGIDLLAGPSELVVLADDSADARWIAADLLAQAEHAPDAMPMLVTTHAPLVVEVEAALDAQLALLSPESRRVASAALANGFAVCCRDLDQAVEVCDRLAPEHLEVMLREPAAVRHYGALFEGAMSAEVLGDYGAGPNHVLPTGGTARFSGGLSVQSFLRARTWLRMDPDMNPALCSDAAALARLEGLEAHARAAERRLVARTR